MRGQTLPEPNLDELFSLLHRTRDRESRFRLREVIRLVRSRHLESAYHLVKQPLLRDATDPLSHYLAGRLARGYGDLILAQSHYTQAIYSTHDHYEASEGSHIKPNTALDTELIRLSLTSLMNLLAHCGRYEELYALIKWRTTVDEHFELYYMYGHLEERSRRLEHAAIAYQNALKLDEKATLSRLALARVKIELGQVDEAEIELKRLRKERPKCDRVWSLSGHVALIKLNENFGLKALKKAIKYNKTSSLAYRLLGDHFFKNEPRRAAKFYLLSQGGDAPTPDLYEKLAKIYERLERYDEAISQLSLLRYFIPADQQIVIQKRIKEVKKLQEIEDTRRKSRGSFLSRWFHL